MAERDALLWRRKKNVVRKFPSHKRRRQILHFRQTVQNYKKDVTILNKNHRYRQQKMGENCEWQWKFIQ